MFKKLHSYSLPILIFVLIISLLSCHGNKTKRDALKHSITKFNDSVKPIEIVNYFPEEYSEVVTDTFLSNGFRVKIKTYTNMDKNAMKTYKTDNITTQTDIYRDWVSEVTIENNGELIWKKTIDEAFFQINGIQKDAFISNSINMDVQVDEEQSIKKDSITLIAGYVNPFEDDALLFNLEIDSDGKHHLKKIRV